MRKSRAHILALMTAVGFTFTCGLVAEDDRAASAERRLDAQAIDLLAAGATCIVVGEVLELNRTQTGYGTAMHADFPFTVKVVKVLKGPGTEEQVTKIGMTRDEVAFRLNQGEKYVFFLKRHPKSGEKSSEPLMQFEWRVVSDYFGAQPHTLTLEHMTSAVAQKRTATAVEHFWFDYRAQPDPGRRVWMRVDDSTWTELYPNGNQSRYKIGDRTKVQGMTGTSVRKISGDPNQTWTLNDGSFEVFIPDKENPRLILAFRHYQEGRWTEWRPLAVINPIE